MAHRVLGISFLASAVESNKMLVYWDKENETTSQSIVKGSPAAGWHCAEPLVAVPILLGDFFNVPQY